MTGTRYRCTFRYEKKLQRQGFGRIAGVDEVGRGALCGPVVAAAVIFDGLPGIVGIDDSKKLTAEQRERLKPQIIAAAVSFGVGIVSAEEVDRMNVYQASLKAMRIAVGQLSPQPDFVLYDGSPVRGLFATSLNLIKGDARCKSIAAASILAKVTRDCLMQSYAALYPGYDWSNNKGYTCPNHVAGLQQRGPTPFHRRSFEPVRESKQMSLYEEEPAFHSELLIH